MKYPEYKVEITKISETTINIKGFIHLGKGEYTGGVKGLTVSIITAYSIIDLLKDMDTIISGKLKDMPIDNGDDKIRFKYEGTEQNPRLYIYNDEHTENKIAAKGGLLGIPLEPQLFWGAPAVEALKVTPKNVELLINEIKKYV